MATYLEIRALFKNSELKNKIQVALVIAAEAKFKAGSTVSERSWASSVISSPSAETDRVLMLVLAKNKDSTVENIVGASQAVIQSNVDDMVDVLVLAKAGE